MRKIIPIIGAWALSVAGLATAEDAWHGPLRPHMELTTQLSEALDVRFGVGPAASAEAGRGERATDAADLGASALVDWDLPTTSGMRLTGGALYGDTDWGWQSEALEVGTIGATSAQTFQRHAEWSPYLGLGWDRDLGDSQRFAFQLDMGVKFEGVSNLDNGEQIERAREEAALSSQFESFRYVPMFSAGVEYRF